ncbi:MAG: CDC27 family protein [Candidatus Obscuribacter sp.]|nr:CDC27 family protein [Candidatus Obscuribacter sp.]
MKSLERQRSKTDAPGRMLEPALLVWALCLLLAAAPPAQARSSVQSLYKEALALYEAGNSAAAYEKFRVLAANQPENARLKYLMGNCLVKQGRVREGLTCFRSALSMGNDPVTEIHAFKAIQLWQGQVQNEALAAAAPARAETPFFMSTTPPKVLTEQLRERRDLLANRREARLKDLKDTFEGQMAAIDRHLAQDIAATPRTILMGNIRVTNPDYQNTVKNLRAEAERRKTYLTELYDKEVREAQGWFDKQLSGLNGTGESLSSQFAEKSGVVKAVPLGSGLYVRNYVNFAGSNDEVSMDDATPPPVALTAVAKKLNAERKGQKKTLPAASNRSSLPKAGTR